MARGDSLYRQLKLMQILDERRAVDVPEIARELGYTQRTVYRDLSVLERLGVPIYQSREGRRARWRVVDGYRRRLSLTLSWSEMLALTAGKHLLAGLSGALFHESAISALEKVRSALPAELVRRADTVATRLSAEAGPWHDYARFHDRVLGLVEAIGRQQTVSIDYRKPGERRPSRRTVDPYHLHVQQGALYLIGYSHERRAVRTFLVDRIESVRPTGHTFERTDFGLAQSRELIHGAFGPWSGKPVRVRLRFPAEVAPYVAERKMHPSQTAQWRSDGSLDVELQAPLSPPLCTWLLGFGSAVEVLAPARLAEALRKEHERAARKRLAGRKRAATVLVRKAS